MGILDRKLRQKEEVRASILDTAWQMVVTEGWHSFSIRKIADAIEYSVPVIYSHFENKDAILLEFNRKGFQLLTSALAQAKAGQPEPENQIRAMGRAYWNFAFENKEYYQLMFGLGIPTCDAARRIPALETFAGVIIGSITAMVPAGQKPGFDPWLKYQSFWSMLHGLVSINMIRFDSPERPVTSETAPVTPAAENPTPREADDQTAAANPEATHDNLPQQVLEDVMCSFIRGIQAALPPPIEPGDPKRKH
jgi:AcrR family transcriptional regulator